MLESFDENLLDFGELIYRCRVETLRTLTPKATERFAQIMRQDQELDLKLTSGLSGDGFICPSEFRASFKEALQHALVRDKIRGVTSVGPHRADLKMILDGVDAKLFASQGQQRSIILALKLAEVEHLTEKLQCAPILLLDDVSSELDVERTKFLFEAISDIDSQVWISTTGIAPLPITRETQLLTIENGHLTD